MSTDVMCPRREHALASNRISSFDSETMPNGSGCQTMGSLFPPPTPLLSRPALSVEYEGVASSPSFTLYKSLYTPLHLTALRARSKGRRESPARFCFPLPSRVSTYAPSAPWFQSHLV